MKLSELPSSRVILILGAPRSGTSWLAKIFDSHPNVLYRHEPDTVLRTDTLPWMCTPEEVPRYRDAAEAYLRQLMDIATLKSAGSIPMFRKHYYGAIQSRARSAFVYGLRIAELAGGARQLVRNVRIPDAFDAARHPEIRVVIKSVSSRGRARLFAEALPGVRIIFILRDPFGQVASMLRGAKLSKFEDTVPVGEVLQTQQALQYGLTRQLFSSLPAVEQLAWNWAILNERAIGDLAGLETVRVVSYQQLGAEPAQESRALFDFVGLDWDPQTEDFIRRSTTHSGRDRYYKVLKDTTAAMNRWRTELTREDQGRILAIVRQTSLAQYCPEIEV